MGVTCYRSCCWLKPAAKSASNWSTTASAHFLKRNHVVIFGVISNQYIKDLNSLGANCQAISWKWNTKRLHASFWIGGSNSQTRNGEHPDAADDTVSPILIATDDKC